MADGRSLTRRQFLKGAAGACAVLGAPWVVPGKVLGLDGGIAPSERITLGGIGIGPRGQHVLGEMLANKDVQFLAICDVRAARREAIKAMADAKNGNKDCSTYRDFYEILARRDLDAVLIATGDRWHTMLSITAAKAGKDIYCEKPCSMTIAESRALADTIRREGRVYQAGTQRRNVANFVYAIQLATGGRLGRLKAVHANTLGPATSQDWLPAEPEPGKDAVDWDRWLGPCPWRPYNSAYVRGGWRGFFDFHGGGILEWGSHTVDLCQAANQADSTAPVEFDPNEGGVVARYQNGVKLVMREEGWLGLGTCSVRFEGEEGWVEAGDSGRIEVFPESLRPEKPLNAEEGTSPRSHVRDFLDCVKSRSQPRASAAARASVRTMVGFMFFLMSGSQSFETPLRPATARAGPASACGWRPPRRGTPP